MSTRPALQTLAADAAAPVGLRRMAAAFAPGTLEWIGPSEAKKLSAEEEKEYALARDIMKYLCIEAPRRHASGHPGGPLSAFDFSYALLRRRDSKQDEALRMGAGHLSVLAYGLQYLGGRDSGDARIASPQAIVEHFRTPGGLPGHAEAGIGDIPFGFGPLGKGLSNALGVALGHKLQKKPGIVDVLESDGSLQEGQAMEAARLATALKLDNLVLHGDVNDIQLTSVPSKTVSCDLASIFAAMGWAVIEVQNGNDPAQVEAALDKADALLGKGRPIFVCYYTTLGHGVATMADASDKGSSAYHGSPMKDADADKELALLRPIADLVQDFEPFRAALKKKYARRNPDVMAAPKGFTRTVTTEKGAVRKDFGATHIKNIMAVDPRVVVLHADLGSSGGFDSLAKDFPDRVINVGVAEANMYMTAAGLRQSGMLPVTYTFAAFGTNEARANARLIDINAGHTACGIIHDCTHTGLSVGEDGETHQERNYLNIPFDRTQVWMPADSNQGAAMAERAFEIIAEGNESVYVFSPRSGHAQLLAPDGKPIYGADYKYDGKIDLVYGAGDTTDQATILAVGIPVHDAIAAATQLADMQPPIKVRVLNVSCVRPIDAATVIEAAMETRHLIVVEDHHSEGGLATQVADIIADFQLPCSLRRLGVNQYFPSGTADDLKFLAGLDIDSIVDAVEDEIRTEIAGGEDAFVTTLFAFAHNLAHSRFRVSAKPFLERLLEEKGYMDALRDIAKKGYVPPEKLPKNEDLRKQIDKSLELSEMAKMGGMEEE